MTNAAVDCALAGIRAVDPYDITRDAVHSAQLTAPVSVVAVGKAARAMMRGALDAVGPQLARGIVIAPPAGDMPDQKAATDSLNDARITSFLGGHPIPNEQGVTGARAIHDLASSLGAHDTLLCLISGGASALAMLPADGVSLADIQQLTSRLLRAGATIQELNCVRKHLDGLKGGRLARLAAPARLVAYVLSDVVGDPLDVIASGPTVPDPTTIADAVTILKSYDVWEDAPSSVRTHLQSANDESPKPGEEYFANTTTSIIGNNTRAALAARVHAESLGYDAAVTTVTMTGEAREVGDEIARHAIASKVTRPTCLIYAGETTVTVTGTGSGGRNQELALGAALALQGHPGFSVASVGTDGIDGPTDAAGAVATSDTIDRAEAMGLDPRHALARNDAYPFWNALGDLVMTGPTGTNVMDLVVVTIDPPVATA